MRLHFSKCIKTELFIHCESIEDVALHYSALHQIEADDVKTESLKPLYRSDIRVTINVWGFSDCLI